MEPLAVMEVPVGPRPLLPQLLHLEAAVDMAPIMAGMVVLAALAAAEAPMAATGETAAPMGVAAVEATMAATGETAAPMGVAAVQGIKVLPVEREELMVETAVRRLHRLGGMVLLGLI